MPVYIGSIIIKAICPLPHCFRCFRRLTLQKCLIILQKKLLPVGSRLLQQIWRQLFKMFKRPLEVRGTVLVKLNYILPKYCALIRSRALQNQWEGEVCLWGCLHLPPFLLVPPRYSRMDMLREDTLTTKQASFPPLSLQHSKRHPAGSAACPQGAARLSPGRHLLLTALLVLPS